MSKFVTKRMAGHYETITKVVKNSEVIAEGDPVSLEDDTAIVTTAGLAIFGVAEEAVTGDGTLAIQIQCGLDIEYEVDNDNDTNDFAAAGYGGGKYFDTIGTTGAVLVDTSSASATSGQLICVDEAPDADDASQGRFKINKAESQF